MEIPNRSYGRNMAMYFILYAVWSVIIIGLLVLFKGGIIFAAGWIAIWAVLIILTARSMLRMPSAIVVEEKSLRIDLIRGRIRIPFDEVIRIEHNPRDCRLRIIAVEGNHHFNDISIDRSGIRYLEEVGRSRGWFSRMPGKK